MTSIAVTHKQTICNQVAQGVKLIEIARQLGISAPAIAQQLTNDPDYQAARMQGLEQRLDDREGELEGASDQLNLARARELLSHARWRCETEGRHIWGKQGASVNVQTDGKVSVTIIDSYATNRVVDLSGKGGQ